MHEGMDLLPLAASGLLTPLTLAFLLGVIAALLRSDFRLPEALSHGLTVYLLLAIGLKGGARLEGVPVADFARPLAAGLALCAAIPAWSYLVLRRRFGTVDAGAIAAHYGSVSVVTFGACLGFLEVRQVAAEGFLPALVAVMEVPGILVALWLARRPAALPALGGAPVLGITAGPAWGPMVRDLLTGKGVLLLLGGLVIGLVCGKSGHEQVGPFFDVPFRGILMIFLLEMGLVAGSRLRDLRAAGGFLVAFAVLMPCLHGVLGVCLGRWAGLSLGGATVLGTLAASASYIAAPAAVRATLPEANPAFYVTASLGVTFPFNLVIGIPLYFAFAGWLFGA